MAVRLLIVDDHTLVGKGLEVLLADSPVDVVGIATTAAEAITQVRETSPDVVLLDVVLGAEDGFQLFEQLKAEQSKLPVIFYTAFDNPRFVARAASLGAAGFVQKSQDRETLIEAIESATSSRPSRVRRPAHRLTGNLDEVDVRVEVALTDREQQVLVKLAEGLTNKEIAQALDISYETVKEHVQHILQKVGVTDRTQVAVWGVRRRLI
jgi:DNA-binding NarL/FixJ family response regulator